MSTSLAYLANNFISASIYSLLITLAYPPSPSPLSLTLTSKNSPPKLSTYSLTAILVSKALTIAPKERPVAIALRPATPPPITKIFAGGNLPAAVIWPVKNLPKWLAAKRTALYPAILAIEERAS